eukprot:GFYU01018284.1.p1 GENE.GFYU01018284.1~~GFYU01018284.1.p1  ORF type:complete len:211 (+),score=30.94 GFYU01018284.1:532-1164(+)
MTEKFIIQHDLTLTPMWYHRFCAPQTLLSLMLCTLVHEPGSLSQGKMEGLTTNRADYTPKEIIKSDKPATDPFAANRPATSNMPFASMTTNKADYVKWDIEKPARPAAAGITRPVTSDGGRYFHTTYENDFQPLPSATVAPLPKKTPKKWRRDNIPRYMETTHKRDFVPRSAELCPATFLPHPLPPASPSTGHIWIDKIAKNLPSSGRRK